MLQCYYTSKKEIPTKFRAEGEVLSIEYIISEPDTEEDESDEESAGTDGGPATESRSEDAPPSNEEPIQ